MNLLFCSTLDDQLLVLFQPRFRLRVRAVSTYSQGEEARGNERFAWEGRTNLVVDFSVKSRGVF